MPKRAVPGTPAEPKPQTMQERLAALSGAGTKQEKTTSTKKKAGPMIEIDDPVIAEQLESAAAGNQVLALLKTPVETAKNEVKGWLAEKVLALWVMGKHRTENADFKTKNCTGTFQIKSMLRFDAPGGDVPALDEQLRQAGVPGKVIEKLMTKVKTETTTGTRTLNELAAGNDKEQAVAGKVFDFIESLPADEKQLFLTNTTKTQIEDDFLDFLPTIDKVTTDNLVKVFSVIRPDMAYNPLRFHGPVLPHLKTLIGDKVGLDGEE